MSSSEWRDNISQKQFNITEERDVSVPMRDGVELAVNVFRPDADGPFPAIFGMAGYGKETQDLDMAPQPLHESAVWDGTIEAGDPQEIVPRGYAQVIADVRGTGHSEGEFIGMMTPQEGRDGYDLIEWIADQEWCDGNVGMTGYSYFSWTTMKTAIEQPPHLEATLVSHALADFYREGVYPGGVLNMFYYGLWDGRNGSSGFAMRNPVSRAKRLLSEEEFERRRQELLDDPDIRKQPNLFHLLNYPYKNPQFFDMMMFPYDGEFWRERSIYPYFDRIEAPMQVVGKVPGLSGFWNVYEGLSAPKRLRVKPAGPEERPWREDIDLFVRWFDHWLKGNDTGLMDEPPIELFVPGATEWRSESEWPLPDSEVELTPCYLRRWGGLSFAPERHQPEPDAFVQQPLHVSNERGSVEYLSPALPKPLEVIGHSSMTFYAEIDQEDVTWIVSIADVGPDGSETGLAKTYLKASHRKLDTEQSEPARPYHPHTEDSVDLVKPGDIYEYTVGFGPLVNVFNPGHRIKVAIETVESPMDEEMLIHFHPHLVSSKTTYHKIYRNEEYRSHVLLPVTDADPELIEIMRDDGYLGQ